MVGTGTGVILDIAGYYGGVDLSGKERDKITEIVMDKCTLKICENPSSHVPHQTKFSPAEPRIIDSCRVLLILFV
jgi:hypothetical protein